MYWVLFYFIFKLSFFFKNFILFIYLFGCSGSQLRPVGSLVAAHRLSCSTCAPQMQQVISQLQHANSQLRHACWNQFSDQGSNPCPLRWEHGVLTTVPPGKSLRYYFKQQLVCMPSSVCTCLCVWLVYWNVCT